MDSKYEDAVNWIASVSEGWIQDGKIDCADLDPTEPILCLNLGIYFEAPEATPLASLLGGSNSVGRYVCGDEAGWNLFEVCEKSPAAYKLLSEISANFIERNEDLPPSLRRFTALQLRGALKQPKKTKIYKTAFRNVWLLSLARTLVANYELLLTRNDESQEQSSACDAVATGLARNGHFISYRAIKEICVGTTSRRIRELSDLWVEAYKTARKEKTIPDSVLDRIWGRV